MEWIKGKPEKAGTYLVWTSPAGNYVPHMTFDVWHLVHPFPGLWMQSPNVSHYLLIVPPED